MPAAEDMLKIAMHQSALDLNATDEDFLKNENVIVSAGLGPHAKKYYSEPIACNFVSYGNNIVASVTDEVRGIVSDYLAKFTFYHCFESPNVLLLDEKLQKVGQRVCFMAEYFIPDPERLKPLSCPYQMRVLGQSDFANLYLPEWSNALCEKRKELDMLGIAAFDGDTMFGFAACSADCEDMWQIGVDVLPAYRRQGIASALTSRLALMIIDEGKVPFYCCAWSNVRSARNAIKSGFAPAWVEMTAKSAEYVNGMNEE